MCLKTRSMKSCIGVYGTVTLTFFTFSCGDKDEKNNEDTSVVAKALSNPALANVMKGLKTIEWKPEASFKTLEHKKSFTDGKIQETSSIVQELNSAGAFTKRTLTLKNLAYSDSTTGDQIVTNTVTE